MGKLILPSHVKRQILEEERAKVAAGAGYDKTLQGDHGNRAIPGQASHPDVANVAVWKWLHQSLKPDEFQMIRIPPDKEGNYQMLLVARIPDRTSPDHVSKMIRKSLRAFFKQTVTFTRGFFNKL